MTFQTLIMKDLFYPPKKKKIYFQRINSIELNFIVIVIVIFLFQFFIYRLIIKKLSLLKEKLMYIKNEESKYSFSRVLTFFFSRCFA